MQGAYTDGKIKEKKNMKHSSPTFLFSDYWFFFHYSEKKINTFFFKLVNIYVFPPGQENQLYYEKLEVSAETTNKKVHSKFLTANLIINVNVSSIIVGKNILKIH